MFSLSSGVMVCLLRSCGLDKGIREVDEGKGKCAEGEQRSWRREIRSSVAVSSCGRMEGCEKSGEV